MPVIQFAPTYRTKKTEAQHIKDATPSQQERAFKQVMELMDDLKEKEQKAEQQNGQGAAKDNAACQIPATAIHRPVPLVIYHGNCQDGFTSAWACWLKNPDWEYYPAKHGDPPPKVHGRDVYLLDFSYKKNVMEQLAKQATYIVVLDHHKTAEEELYDLPWNVQGKFDMDKSGAMLAWEYFHQSEEVPAIVKYVKDRDLWRFQYEDTKAITAALFSIPYDFEQYSAFHRLLEYDFSSYEVIMAGQAILNKQKKDVEELCQNKFRSQIGGHNVWCLNVPYIFASDAGHIMCQGEPFAATYYFDGKDVIWSLRSDDDGLDVSEIAKAQGGGGHKHAAGFKVSVEPMAAFFKEFGGFADKYLQG